MGIASKLIISGEVEDNLICSKCSKVLEDPCPTVCGHHACEQCLSEEDKKSRCQKCFKPLVIDKETEIPQSVITALAQLSFHCPLGCDQVLDMQQLKVHSTQECQWRLAKCPNRGCKEEIKVKDMDTHCSECPFMLIECNVCKAVVTKQDMPAHQAVKRCFERLLNRDRVQSARRLSGELKAHRQIMLEQRHLTDQGERRMIRDHYQRQQSAVIRPTGRMGRSLSVGAVVGSQSIQSRIGSAVLVVPRYSRSISFTADSCGKCESKFLSGRRPSARRDSHSKVSKIN